MKKITLLISGIFVLVCFSNCNQSDKKANDTSGTDTAKTESSKTANTGKNKILIDDDCGGMDNLIIKKEEADEMRSDYNKFFINATTSSKHLAPYVWIDGHIIVGFDDLLLKTNKNYDGVRFINMTDGATTETSLILVPTVERATPIPDLSNHVNDWTAVLLQPAPEEEFRRYNLGSSVTDRLKGNFKTMYQTQLPCDDNSCLSSTVWVSECVIHVLRQIIEDRTNNVDGIKVLFGAYKDKSHQVPGQRALRQSTVILVPTHLTGDVHEEDWTIIKERVEFRPKNVGFNHGELCPNSCNDDDSKVRK